MNEKAKTVSKAFKSRPHEPLETALYWIEYVIENNGADLLRPHSVQMSWITYYSVDTISFLVLVVILTLYLTGKALNMVKLWGKSSKKEKVN
jgi:glucuronosyltransferase